MGEFPEGKTPDVNQAGGAASFVDKAWALQSFGRFDDAIAEVRRGLAEYPEDADLLGPLAWLEFFYGNREQAEVAAKQSLAVRPDDWRGLTILTEIAVARGDLAEGERLARELLQSRPDWESAHLNLAHVLAQPRSESRKARKSRFEAVRNSATTAVRLAPEHVDTLRRASVFLAMAGDERGSTEVLNRALALDPTNEQLLLLVAGSQGTGELEGLRILSGVLTENPQQRAAARALSARIWKRTAWLATFLLIVLVGLLLFGYLVFEEGVTSSSRQRRQIGGAFIAAVTAWIMLLVFVRRTLPRGYLRRLYNSVWWVWIGLGLAAVGFLGTLFLAFSFAARSLPAQYQLNGPYIGGLTATLCFIAVIALVGELCFVFARFASETRNRIFAGDDQGLDAARADFRRTLMNLAIRGGAAIVLAFIPVIAAGIATRPEAAGAFGAVALAVGVTPLVSAVLAAALVTQAKRGVADRGSHSAVGEAGESNRDGGRLRAVWAALLSTALIFSVVSVGAAFMLSQRHASEFDPPPTPWELEHKERISNLDGGLDELKELAEFDHEEFIESTRQSTGGFQEESE